MPNIRQRRKNPGARDAKIKIKDAAIKKIKENKQKYFGPDGYKLLGRDISANPKYTYIAVGKTVATQLGWEMKLDPQRRIRLGTSLNKLSIQMTKKINFKTLGKELTKGECIKGIEKQLIANGINDLYSQGVASKIFENRKVKMKQNKIWNGM